MGKIRLGLVGASVKGTWSARSHLPALKSHTEVELAAVCTTRRDSAEAARAAWGARLAFDSYAEMAASPDIDAVAVVVRVPTHFGPVKAALEAGKHVYCEWPLGRTTEEAVTLASLARSRGLQTMVGLQARAHPVLLHMKQMIESGAIGDVTSVNVRMLREGSLVRPASRMWQKDVEAGATTLTIPGGHTLDAARFVAGDVASLSGIVSTQVKEWLNTGTQKPEAVSSPDQVILSGRLKNDAVFSLHVGAVPHAGSGFRLEVYGRKGTLVAAGSDSPQLSEIRLWSAIEGDELQPVELADAWNGLPREALNVARLYGLFAESIRSGKAIGPSFDTAVELHRLLDGAKQASDLGIAWTGG